MHNKLLFTLHFAGKKWNNLKAQKKTKKNLWQFVNFEIGFACYFSFADFTSRDHVCLALRHHLASRWRLMHAQFSCRPGLKFSRAKTTVIASHDFLFPQFHFACFELVSFRWERVHFIYGQHDGINFNRKRAAASWLSGLLQIVWDCSLLLTLTSSQFSTNDVRSLFAALLPT